MGVQRIPTPYTVSTDEEMALYGNRALLNLYIVFSLNKDGLHTVITAARCNHNSYR